MRPNILYIHSHDTGRYVSPYGFAFPTPHYQAFAKTAVIFRQAFCAGPTCSPSRAALLTGMAPHSAGMLGLAHRGFSLRDASNHLAHHLKKSGYETTLAGMQHVVDGGRYAECGYTRVVRRSSDLAKDVAPAAVEYLQSAPKEPFFLDAGFFETHREFPRPDPDLDANFLRPPEGLPDAKEIREDMAGYATSARRLDEGVGNILAALEKSGLAERTVVFITTDHGLAFPHMKCHLEDAGIGVLLMMRAPGISGGRSVDSLVSHIDIFPTLCDLAGLEKPERLQGKSLLPILQGKAEEVNGEIFSEVTYHAAYEPQRCVRTKRYKFIRRFDGRQDEVFPNVDDSPSKSYLLERNWKKRPENAEALYNLDFDPLEKKNLVNDPQLASVAAELRAKLEAWMKRTDDPLLKGAVAPPQGAKVNAVDGISPREEPKVY
ncbi:MAG: sulfatase [Spirochaetia bacterium]|nr:sulfatase [Spirochaetia bacterium]